MRAGRPIRRACRPIDSIFGASSPVGIAFAIEHVERILQVIEELRAGVEALRGGEAHVVAVERVRHDEMRHALDAAVALDLDVASSTAGRRRRNRRRRRSRRVRRRDAACSGCRGRCTSRAARCRTDRAGSHVASAMCARSVASSMFLVADPAQSVAGDLVAEFAIRGDGFGMPLQALARRRRSSAADLRDSNARSTRHKPAREPYSYSDSMLMWRAAKRLRADDLGQETSPRRRRHAARCSRAPSS